MKRGKNNKGFYKKGWFWLVLIIIILGLAILFYPKYCYVPKILHPAYKCECIGFKVVKQNPMGSSALYTNICYGIYLKNYIDSNTIIISKNDCDKSILFEKGKSYINKVRFEDDGIVLIGNFEPSTVYNENNSVASNKQIDPKIMIGQQLTIYLTEECTSQFKLINYTNQKAIIEHHEGCGPPGPSEKKDCIFEIVNQKPNCYIDSDCFCSSSCGCVSIDMKDALCFTLPVERVCENKGCQCINNRCTVKPIN